MTNKPTTIFLVTNSFPYEFSVEYPFLTSELPYLLNQFDRVVIVPCQSGKQLGILPNGIEVNETYALKPHSFFSHLRISIVAFTFGLFWKELLRRPRTLIQPEALAHLLTMAGMNQRMRIWLRSLIKREKLDLSRTVFYTYWSGLTTLGVGLLKQEFPNLIVISRAHGFDLYKYRFKSHYIPLQSECLKRLDKLFLISEDGRKYITEYFPWLIHLCEVSRLGVFEPMGIVPLKNDNKHRIISCSYLTAVKRIDLLVEGLIRLSTSHPEEEFVWYHFGGGPLFDKISELTKKTPINLRVFLLGNMSNDAVKLAYRETPFNLFVNVSSAEGISVAIMEAMSYGIPVVGTNVGGTPEIVSEQNGALLPKDPSPQQIAEILWRILSDPIGLAKKREMSIKTWRERFNASKNYDDFARKIRSLLN